MTAAACVTVHLHPPCPFACLVIPPFACLVIPPPAQTYEVKAVEEVVIKKVCGCAAGIPLCTHPEAHAAHSHVPAAAGQPVPEWA